MRTRFRWIACLSVAAFAIVGLSCAQVESIVQAATMPSDPWEPPGSAPNGLDWVICDEARSEVNIQRIPGDRPSAVELPTQGHRLEVPAGALGPTPNVHTVVFVQPRTRYIAVSAHAERVTGPQGAVRLRIGYSARTNCRGEDGAALVNPVVVRIDPHNENHTVVREVITREEPEGTITVSLDSLSTFSIAD